ncbi:hypothetical protein SLEP1_g6730 [Rubroshorea leprosula]|uniref:Uncharacterized protein n=1 Tax=Rubroshorea leprosula TaxID=152421 RepID=A0AAV5I2H5_9ROSI|nr:hypothetical protein SLEP1_g6730 [Rubroshorea leprosula]
MARANQNAETSSIASTEVPRQGQSAESQSSIELEQEELEKAAKFKARPLNKKIFEGKGELGISCHEKKQVTIPQEFHFATNERIPAAAAVVNLFDKLSLKSEPRHDPITKYTIPNPFHLHTESLSHPQDQNLLESLVRHEEEMQREMEERWRKEKEEAQMRLFKAQPILKEDQIPVPEKVRKPLTQVQELHVDHRAVDRAEFDQRIKEKEMIGREGIEAIEKDNGSACKTCPKIWKSFLPTEVYQGNYKAKITKSTCSSKKRTKKNGGFTHCNFQPCHSSEMVWVSDL